ncbi:MAG: Holliday junction resolvase RuvX [Alphaproteobacteria bacterium]
MDPRLKAEEGKKKEAGLLRQPTASSQGRGFYEQGFMIIEIDQLASVLKPGQRLLGLDYGDKFIGISLSDTRCKIATPHSTLKRKDLKTDLNALVEMVESYNAAALIIGMPFNMNGSEGERCKLTRKFVQKFLSFYDMPLILWDERLSTKAAMDILISGDMSFQKRDKAVDKIAAAYILQGVLDYLEHSAE